MKKLGGRFLIVVTAALIALNAQWGLAQSFKKVSVQGSPAMASVSAGSSSVWALDQGGNPYVLQNNTFVSTQLLSLSKIAVGGGTAVQPDQVWAVDSSDNVYNAVRNGSSWTFSQVPGVLTQIAVGPGYQDSCHPYEVWGINPAGAVFRYNSCSKQFEQFSGTLAQIVVGSGDVWGLNSANAIFKLDFGTLKFKQLPGSLTKIAIGPEEVWGVNSSQQVFVLNPFTQKFIRLSGVLAQIQAGGNGLWGLNSSLGIFRFEPATFKFVQIQGTLTSISVGTGAGVWGINSSADVYAFSTP